MSKIELTDSPQEIVMKMSDGNPGALTVLMELITKSGDIDPDAALGPFAAVLSLDTFGIYGTDIYVLWSDICGRNLADTVAVLRAVQLGLFDQNTLKDACSRQDYSGKEMVPVKELYAKVVKELPKFNGGVIDADMVED